MAPELEGSGTLFWITLYKKILNIYVFWIPTLRLNTNSYLCIYLNWPSLLLNCLIHFYKRPEEVFCPEIYRQKWFSEFVIFWEHKSWTFFSTYAYLYTGILCYSCSWVSVLLYDAIQESLPEPSETAVFSAASIPSRENKCSGRLY